jgi:hypothetical protein
MGICVGFLAIGRVHESGFWVFSLLATKGREGVKLILLISRIQSSVGSF